MPGPPSQLHHPALLFSWVARLITDPRWHAIGRASTHVHTHTRVYTQNSTSYSFFPSLSLTLAFLFLHFFLSHCHIFSSYSAPPNFFLSLRFLFSPLFFCHSVTFSSLAPGTLCLSFSVSLLPILLFLVLLSFSDILPSPPSLHSHTVCAVFHSPTPVFSHLPSPSPLSSFLAKSQGTRVRDRRKGEMRMSEIENQQQERRKGDKEKKREEICCLKLTA